MPEVLNDCIFLCSWSIEDNSVMQWDKRYYPIFGGSSGLRPELEEKEDVQEITEEHVLPPWHVILYNDEIHTFDEVIIQLIKATGCSLTQAEELTWEVHLNGKARVYEGAIDECLRVSSILQEIQLITEIRG